MWWGCDVCKRSGCDFFQWESTGVNFPEIVMYDFVLNIDGQEHDFCVACKSNKSVNAKLNQVN